ncbi:helix-turn-helix domain-containing protein [Rhodococcus sp. NPDC127530]|uniref:helix-turn-helix domain-containing protein n=1 Tax=unclassified Rhodococcus (in: high G+C Gram-positive bacteria) TaxID=192944 RepID=UPI0036279C91
MPKVPAVPRYLGSRRGLRHSVSDTDAQRPVAAAKRPNSELLRSFRGKLSLGQVGLTPTPTVRRVPGLRREELAQFAGVSVDYYTRLERGRNVDVSVLDAIALVSP